jgi:hypothetical protein
MRKCVNAATNQDSFLSRHLPSTTWLPIFNNRASPPKFMFAPASLPSNQQLPSWLIRFEKGNQTSNKHFYIILVDFSLSHPINWNRERGYMAKRNYTRQDRKLQRNWWKLLRPDSLNWQCSFPASSPAITCMLTRLFCYPLRNLKAYVETSMWGKEVWIPELFLRSKMSPLLSGAYRGNFFSVTLTEK